MTRPSEKGKGAYTHPGTDFQVTPALAAYLKANSENPGKAEMTPGAKAALDKMTDADLAEFAKQVKVRVGEPVNLTNEQNAAFRASGGDLPEIARAEPMAEPSQAPTGRCRVKEDGKGAGVPYRPPGGKFAGPGGASGSGSGSVGSLRNAWTDRFASFDDFKAWVLRPDPEYLHVGLQKFVVMVRIGKPLVDQMAQKVSGCFATEEEAEAHARRCKQEFPYFDYDVLSMYNLVPYPVEDKVMRGVKRLYDDDNMDAALRSHYEQNTESKSNQMDRIAEAMERAKNPCKFAEEDAERARHPETGEFPPSDIQFNAIDDVDSGIYDDVRCK